MPADLTAAELIALLREHPGCCGALGLRIQRRLAYLPHVDFVRCDENYIDCDEDASKASAAKFRRWLNGAAVEKCDELGVIVGPSVENGVTVWHNGTGNGYATRLHALLAGLEAHCKETTNGR